MDALDNELLQGAEEDLRTLKQIRARLSREENERFSDDHLYYFIDILSDYFEESGVLEAKPDKNGFVEIDEEAAAAYMAAKAKEEKMGTFCAEELLPIVDGILEDDEDE